MENVNKPENQGNNRNPDGTFKDGISGNPNGRPKGKTIKERVREWLEGHPDDMEAFVKHFIEKNKELTWQMLEGRPQTDITSGGEPLMLNIEKDVADKYVNPNPKNSSQGQS